MGTRNTVLLLVTAAVLASCAGTGENRQRIEGTVTGTTLKKVYLQKFNNKMYDVIDSADIVDDKFVFSKNLELPEIYALTLDTTGASYMLFLDGNPVTVQLNAAPYYSNSVTTGSESQDLFVAYQEQPDVKIDEFIKQHPKSLVSAYVLYRNFSYRLSAKEITANIQLLDQSLWNTPYVKVLEDLVKTLETVEIGKQAPDFMSTDPLGNSVSLSQSYGKSYILVDFWAAWCAPCRMVAPVLEAISIEYKDKLVVGKLNIDDYPAIAQKYGVMSIPTMILFVKGKEEKRIVGAQGKGALIAELAPYLA